MPSGTETAELFVYSSVQAREDVQQSEIILVMAYLLFSECYVNKWQWGESGGEEMSVQEMYVESF